MLTSNYSPASANRYIRTLPVPFVNKEKDRAIAQIKVLIETYELEMKYWKKEYQAMKKLVSRMVFKKINSAHYHDNPFEQINDLFKIEFPKLEIALNALEDQIDNRSFVALKRLNEAAKDLGEVFYSFEKQLKKARLDLYGQLSRHIPLEIF